MNPKTDLRRVPHVIVNCQRFRCKYPPLWCDSCSRLAPPRRAFALQHHRPKTVDSLNAMQSRLAREGKLDSNNETHASNNPTSLWTHCTRYEFEKLFSNLPLALFRTVADPFFPLCAGMQKCHWRRRLLAIVLNVSTNSSDESCPTKPWIKKYPSSSNNMTWYTSIGVSDDASLPRATISKPSIPSI